MEANYAAIHIDRQFGRGTRLVIPWDHARGSSDQSAVVPMAVFGQGLEWERFLYLITCSSPLLAGQELFAPTLRTHQI
jgi:hypothetical protein